jgi:hypothetical protein
MGSQQRGSGHVTALLVEQSFPPRRHAQVPVVRVASVDTPAALPFTQLARSMVVTGLARKSSGLGIPRCILAAGPSRQPGLHRAGPPRRSFLAPGGPQGRRPAPARGLGAAPSPSDFKLTWRGSEFCRFCKPFFLRALW